VNAAGGVNGRKIVLETLDDGFEPKRSVENAKKLIDEKGVLALFLFRGTANAEAMMPVIAEKKTVLFAGVGSSIKMHEPMSRYLFNLRRPGADRGHQRVNQLASQGINDVAVIYTDDGFGKDALDGAQKGVRQEQDHAQGGWPRSRAGRRKSTPRWPKSSRPSPRRRSASASPDLPRPS